MNLLFEAQVKSKKTKDAVKTMEEIVVIYKRATQGPTKVEASPPSGVSAIEKQPVAPVLRADPTLVEYLSALTSLYLEIGEKALAVKALDEVDELLKLFKTPADPSELMALIQEKLKVIRPKVEAARSELERAQQLTPPSQPE